MTTRPPLSRGAQMRHKAHMTAIKAIRQAAVDQRYAATEPEDCAIELSDSATETLAESLKSVVDAADKLSAAADRLNNMEVSLDEASIAQLSNHMRAAFLQASRESLDGHTKAIQEALTESLKAALGGTVTKAIQETAPQGSALQKAGAVAAIAATVIVGAMASAYAYAVFNYQPPVVDVSIDAAMASGGL